MNFSEFQSGLPRKNVIILTAGLSGSSFVAGLLKNAGYWAGAETCKKPDYDTFENKVLVAANEDLLSKDRIAGVSCAGDRSDAESGDCSQQFSRIDPEPYRQFIRDCNDHEPWVWKDPRLRQTLRFWLGLLDRKQVKILIVTREYSQAWISRVLRRHIETRRYCRENISSIRNSFATLTETYNVDHLEVVYENLLLHPQRELRKLNGFLGTDIAVADLERVYTGPLHRRRHGLIDYLHACLIYLKNFRTRKRLANLRYNQQTVSTPVTAHSSLLMPVSAESAAESRPKLLVVVDTEEEFDWFAPFNRLNATVRNIQHQRLAQAIMDQHGVVPTYVVDYPVVESSKAASVLLSIAARGGCEIGAHLHPWVNPPHVTPTDEFHSYPGNLASNIEREKIGTLRDAIERTFGARPVIYKAGRYGIGPSTFKTLEELGFRVDVSVVPHTSFAASQGPDFNEFPSAPFWPWPGLLALPMSVHFVGLLARAGPYIFPFCLSRIGQIVRAETVFAAVGLLERLRLTPEGHSLSDMMRQTKAALARGERIFMLTYHSTSLLPGANPYVRTETDRQRFLSILDGYFRFFIGECRGEPISVRAFADLIARDLVVRTSGAGKQR